MAVDQISKSDSVFTIGGRKFVWICASFTVSTLFVLGGYANFKEWSEFNKWAFAMYATSNVVPKISETSTVKKRRNQL